MNVIAAKVSFLFALLCLHACSAPKKNIVSSQPNSKNVLEKLLESQPEHFKTLLDNRDSFHLQIIYTQIDRDKNNNPVFKDYTVNINPNKYFYPASTVKMPVSLLALERLNELKETGIDKNTIMITDSNYHKQQIVYNHPFARDGKPSIAQYIKEIFLVSDNQAYNRLYEFLGQQYINERLHNKGYKEVEILHRLSVSLTADENRHTNAVTFYDTSGKVLYKQDAQHNQQKYSIRNNKLGKGFYSSGSLVNEPFDFSAKNKISLTSLHNILKSVIFPNAVRQDQRFNLTRDDYKFLLGYMSAKPSESRSPVYDTSEFHDNYVKFLLMGHQKSRSPENIRIFNKVGDAYGFLTDVAYVVDFKTNVEFLLSATLLCNGDGIFNDDKYDYETIGFPFMKNLGQLIYDYEKQRIKQYVPDLSNFRINYKELE